MKKSFLIMGLVSAAVVAASIYVSNTGSAAPDIQILLHGNKYGVAGLGDDFKLRTATGVLYLCPLAVFNGGYISDLPASNMEHFLEVKTMKIDAQGRELAYTETYKPGPGQVGWYAFEAFCLPGEQCPRRSLDTIMSGQWDEYYVNDTVQGAGIYAVYVKVNAHENPQGHPAPIFTECNGCYSNDEQYFSFTYDSTAAGWVAVHDDSFLTGNLKARLKNHK